MDESQLHATLLGNIREGVIATDLEGTIIYWNEGATRIFGYTANEMTGKTPVDLYPGQNDSELWADLGQIDEGTDYTGEWRGRRKDGSEVWVEVTTAVARDPSGTPIGYVGISRDITERKQLEEEVSRLLEREQRTHQRLRRFLALVAHELRQPLTVIRGTVPRLLRSHDQQNENGTEPYLRLIDDASARMERLIEDILDAAKIGVSQFTIHPVEMDLVETIQLVVSEHGQDTAHRVVVDAPDQVWGWWDRDRLIQLFTNLLTNAFKYASSGTEVRIEVEETGSEVVIRVIDDGPGIPPRQQEFLFEAFSRLEDGTDDSGLGLYIGKGIVDAHGGQIWVESEVGKGCQFMVVLPLSGPPDQPPDGIQQNRSSAGTASPADVGDVTN